MSKSSKFLLFVVLALVLGLFFGVLLPNYAIETQILSDIFLRLIKMIMAPLV
ncbi:MAG: hypothetical protein EAZ27_08315, partial [Cytophagales bacterium]